MVSTRGYFSGTHQGEFMGVTPSGEGILVKYIDQWRIEDGKAVESWVSLDLLGLMQQIQEQEPAAPAVKRRAGEGVGQVAFAFSESAHPFLRLLLSP